MREYTPFLHIKLLNELHLLELEIEKTDDIISVSVSKEEAKKALISHNSKVSRYKKKKKKLEKILKEDEDPH